ncbi:hypothetical protein [Parapedobacter sp. 10938]|uniref:hypothetical protein n=1 Tax=Parapedobacter flavus TaxID=3110225 RepID=UPI002DB96E92|nr:hypothetical protein [Parapedobacter sp. 10938]MEC3881302.1 hypothetical protein [Parapedobacter sp. 10938]
MTNIQALSKKILFVLLIGAAFTGCSKDDKGPDNKEEEETTAGADHTFDVTLVNKADAANTIEYKGAAPNDEARAIYRNRTISGETEHSITMLFGKLEEAGSIYGNFDLDDDDQPFTELGPYHLADGGVLEIRPEGTADLYTSVSGTLTFSDLKYALPTASVGAAAYTLKFEGDFAKYTSGTKSDETYHASGTFVISPEDDMGTYKAP